MVRGFFVMEEVFNPRPWDSGQSHLFVKSPEFKISSRKVRFLLKSNNKKGPSSRLKYGDKLQN